MKRSLFRSTPSTTGQLTPAALTPLVDIFTLIVVGLLRAASSSPDLALAEKHFQLPITTAQDVPSTGVTVDVGKNGIYVDGWRIASTRYWTSSEEILIDDLYEGLQTIGGETAQLRAHADAPWTLVDKTLFTMKRAGIANIELVALSNTGL